MAVITIDKYKYIGPDGIQIFSPIGSFPASLESSSIQIGANIQSSDPACHGVISGYAWLAEDKISLMVLTVYQK